MRARKGGFNLLLVGAREHRELDLPLGWSLRITELYVKP
jgi:hypothetical protein